ncbi:MAG: orotate phosphoribosyltransferase, partial [Pseudomonadales bacterium]|nr:orotate phosphoribosyltransferase [Pseudomonadales bacterium]
MQDFQNRFIELCLTANALRFGEFTLKSGRSSPYFFNAGEFNRGSHLATLGECYAAKIVDSGIAFDSLFGPAYKGIPLVAVTAAALASQHGIDVPYTFNRKEAKAHGEGGNLVGAELRGRILIVDDVITAGTAVREVIKMLGGHSGVSTAGVLVGLDRQERSQGELSAVEALQTEFTIAVESIIGVEHLLEYLSKDTANLANSPKLIARMQEYRQKYGSQSS